VAAELTSGGVLRLGTSQGLGERLPQVLDELARTAPTLRAELVSVPADRRLAIVRSGQLDAAFVRAVPQARDLELLPLWNDPLVAALPATHAFAAYGALDLWQLRDLPLRLAPRDDNPAFHDIVLAACAAAGFQPILGPAFANAHDTLAEIGTGHARRCADAFAGDRGQVRVVGQPGQHRQPQLGADPKQQVRACVADGGEQVGPVKSEISWC
jgi:DNA-binding transcriptional LysR family regulator